MFPPKLAGQAEYAPLATDENLDVESTGGEAGSSALEADRDGVLSFDINDTYEYDSPPLKRRLSNFVGHPVFRPLLLALGLVLMISIFKIYSSSTSSPSQIVSAPPLTSSQPGQPDIWTEKSLNFTSSRPAYLSSPPRAPLIIRLAIIARVDAFERRQAIREAVLTGIKGEDVKINYRFFVARPREAEGDVMGLKTRLGLERERQAYGDVEVIQAFKDVPERISEKRFEALKWTNAVPHDTYDYSMTVDSDTFCRFSALARRLAYTHRDAKPREQPIMIGRMGMHQVYFQNTVPDGNENDSDEDYFVKGPWYKYPIGIGSNLTKNLLDLDPPVAHHINYPSDDVMIGSWIAALKFYHDPDAKFVTTEHDPPPDRVVHPDPLLPYELDTEIIDDQVGWHDVWRKEDGEDGQGKRGIGWDSVCIHRMGIAQMRALRAMQEVKDEWDKMVM